MAYDTLKGSEYTGMYNCITMSGVHLNNLNLEKKKEEKLYARPLTHGIDIQHGPVKKYISNLQYKMKNRQCVH